MGRAGARATGAVCRPVPTSLLAEESPRLALVLVLVVAASMPILETRLWIVGPPPTPLRPVLDDSAKEKGDEKGDEKAGGMKGAPPWDSFFFVSGVLAPAA